MRLKFANNLLFTLILSGFAFYKSVQAQEEVQDIFIRETSTQYSQVQGYGWGQHYRLSGNLSFNENSRVIGKNDGLTTTFGGMFLYEGGYRTPFHNWRYHLSIRQSATKTPEIPKLIKTEDQLLLSTEYLYSYITQPAFGPFLAASLELPLFASHDVNAEVTNYVVTYVDGSQDSFSASEIRLTDPFFPLTLRQSLGLYFFPLEHPEFHLELRSGIESRQIFLEDQLVINDNKDTENVVELRELENIYLAGWLNSARVYGQLHRDAIYYEIFGDVVVPLVINESRESNKSKWKLYHLNSGARLVSKLSSWLQLEYAFQLKREPLILDEFQMSHLIQLNLLIERFFGTHQPTES